jgi:hypothetical protein
MKRLIFPALFFVPLLILIVGSCRMSSPPPQGIAVIYGVTQYNIANDLVLTRPDSEAVAELFESKGYEVLLRIDNDNGIPASVDQLEQDIEYVKNNLGLMEQFVFYFSGHGGRHYDFYLEYSDEPGTEIEGSDPDDEWLFLYGSLPSYDFEEWPQTAVTEERLGEMIAEIPSPMKLIIIDACNSGGFIGPSADVDTIPQNYYETDNPYSNTSVSGIFSKSFSLYFSYPSVPESEIPASNALVLSAAGELEESWEASNLGHGIFTYYLLQTGEYGDVNGDGWVSVDEVYAYTSYQIVENWVAEMPSTGHHYHPHLSGGPVTFALFAAD